LQTQPAYNIIPIKNDGGGYMGGNVYRDKKSGHYYIQIYWQRKQERFFTFESNSAWYPFETQRHANKVLSIMQGQIDNEEFVPAAWRPGSPLSISKYSEQWLDSLSVCNNTKRFYRTCIKRCVTHFGTEKDIRQIRYTHLRRFYNDLDLADKGKYHTLNTLKAMLRCAVLDCVLKKMPGFPRLSETTDSDIEYLNFEEQRLVIEAIPERHRAIIMFGMETGMRIGEVRALQKDSINERLPVKRKDGSIVYVRGVVMRRSFSGNELRQTTKTGKPRQLPLTRRAIKILKSAHSFSDFVFTLDGQKPYREKELRKIWKTACQEVGIEIHLRQAMRHSLGCQLLDEGQELELVRDIYGHTSTNMTRRYAKRSPQRILDALEQRGNVVELKGVRDERTPRSG